MHNLRVIKYYYSIKKGQWIEGGGISTWDRNEKFIEACSWELNLKDRS